ncbi:hypothetical protein [Paenibacillus senegalensis]|uniref:hypothetical protein n=1 Tax=Paenibacillus senegalensis TaxID=1465766 RepID=UPI0011DDED49|nr:hypothetical protein [Paenibacillus senegalensis]
MFLKLPRNERLLRTSRICLRRCYQWGQVRMYYGASDELVAGVTFELSDLLEQIRQNNRREEQQPWIN